MLISLHLPKTAGTSFLALLRAHFGDQLREDYADMPLHDAPLRRRTRALRAGFGHAVTAGGFADTQCVHGHFLALKYRYLRTQESPQFVTWLRDPVERLASHFYYWQRSYDPAHAGSLHRRMMDEAWDFERFCFAPELRDLYAQFLWGMPLRRFAFVGVTEHYAADVHAFSARYLGGRAIPAPENTNDDREVGARTATYVTDAKLRQAIERFHAKDMALYRQALALRGAADA